jgi:signal transduction histidine kinase
MGVLQKEPSGKEVLRFELDSAGKLVFPPPVAAIPVPDAAGDAVNRYRAGVLAMQEGRDEEALQAFEAVARDHPEAVGETGLPLKPLAQLKWIELANRVPQLRDRAAAMEDSLGSNAVFQPGILTPQILQRLAGARWREEWERHEMIRAIYESARSEMRVHFPRLLWAGDWLLARQEGHGGNYLCWHANVVEGRAGQAPFAFTASIGTAAQNWNAHEAELLANPINRKLVEFAGRLPRYFDYSLEMGGKTIASTNALQLVVRGGGSKGSGRPWVKSLTGRPPEGAFGASTRTENGAEYLKAAIHLISPEMLYERQRDRALLFGLLIAASAAAAVIGCYSALRAFQRQHRLAELKSDFVSSVSHELRAPIASVRLMAEGLERGSVTESEKQQEYFRFIVQECRRLGAMIENVLDFSRIDQDRKEYEFEPTDLPKLVEQTVKFMEPYAAERQVTLEAQIAGEVGEAQVDGRAIQQALVNLIDNAVKHSPQQGEVRIVLDGTDSVRLAVTDQGPGVPANERTKIFERFYRCGSELRRETQGVGIGLSIVKHIVDAHSGTIHVSGEPGKGSIFTIVLPRERKEENES